MNAKTQVNPLASKTDNKLVLDRGGITPTTESEQVANVEIPSNARSDAKARVGSGLSAEVIELLNELRDTVKGLNPRRHTIKTLRRALSNVSEILADLEKLYEQG